MPPTLAGLARRALPHALADRIATALRPQQGQRRVEELWGEQAGTPHLGGSLLWTELPRVQARLNRLVSGNPAVDPYQHVIQSYLQGRLPVGRALTIGCGAGELERGLARYGFCLRHDALDVAPGAIEKARAAAEAARLDHIRYEVRDGNRLQLPPSAYAVIFGVHSVHHLERLEAIFAQVAGALEPGGLFVLNEFVGPTRFQWTDRQLEAVNSLLTLLPERLRVSCRDGRSVIRRVERPTIRQMIAIDPSEAVRSAEILPLLPRYFDVLEVAGQGGSVLHLLLHDIAGNFHDGDPEAVAWLELCFDVEDRLLASGEVSHDFALIVARRR